ncbi:hypothetical protein BCD67_09945 [Oscillatoriales cyanobacterium USR001]|nr:hypothetical protein BCD67_09945 [Oscillatoriales cyanobacterium USR001]
MLQNFIEVVPLCQPNTRLSTLRLIFRRGKWDRVAVVNDLHQPLGIVYLSRLLQKRLVYKGKVRHHGELLSMVKPTIIEPLIVLSADMSLPEFGIWLQEQQGIANLKNQEKNTCFNDRVGQLDRVYRDSQGSGMSPGAIADLSTNDNTYLLPPPNSPPIALIEPGSGKFLGLLDTMGLLKFIAIEGLHKEGTKKREEENSVNSSPYSLTPSYLTSSIYSLTPSSLRQNPYPLAPSSSFVELLEQLPLPLRLMGSDGQIISSNAAWKSLLGDEPEPSAIASPTANNSPQPLPYRDAGNSSIASTSTPEGSNRILLSEAQEYEETISRPILSIALEEKKITPASIPSWCEIVAAPDIYACISSTNQGKDRLWQFVKQPISETLTLVLAQDVTEEHLVAKELIAKNTDLIQLNRLKDEFLACISHELKTPLTAILGLSSLLKDRAIGELNDRQTRYAKLIHASGRHLMTVVNDILDLTRIETNQMELSVETVQITTVCDRAFEGASILQQQEDKLPHTSDISNSEPKTKIDFTLEIEPELTHIVADELRLRQMLVNLLSNALKFTPEGGKIGLKVNHWEGWIAFTVWDTGIGIPAEKQHLLFQKFQQLESPLTRRFQGTGLGLVLTQRLARLHGGDVSFISSEGQGSQFTLLLPPCLAKEEGVLDWGLGIREREEENASLHNSPYSQNLSSVPKPSPRLVLIVETVPQFVEDLTNLLTGLDYRVLVARSGTEALEKARRFRPEVIFLNPLLPLLSGWDVLTLLKNDTETSSIPAIVTATRGEKERAAINRAEGFLSLPVKESALLGQLQKLLRQSQSPPKVSQSQPKIDLPKNSLTVLLLSPLNKTFHAASFLIHPSYCQVLEADDLDQAELLARIWHPNVMVLENVSQFENHATFIEELSRSSLISIPLVTLDPITTQLANQVKGLSVFPCLAPSDRSAVGELNTSGLIASALWQVIQAAIGIYSDKR